MIRLYFHPTPNPVKVALFLEEASLPYALIPVDTRKGEQHAPGFRAINPNGKTPALVDTDGPAGETRVFDSTAILLFIASGLGPFSGQSVHFQRATPEHIPYAANRYLREAQRHYQVLEDHLSGRDWIVGDGYTIADMSAWGWIDRASYVLGVHTDPLAAYPNLSRWFEAVEARPAVARARAAGENHSFKIEMDEQARRALYPSNYPRPA